jgi:hypothetical protein
MTRIENISKEQVTKLIAKFIKEQSKKIGDRTNMELVNWVCGVGRDKKWSHTEIRFDGNSYIFKDKKITEEQFVCLLNKALEESGVKGKVFYDVYDDGYCAERQTIFGRLEIFGKPCKEFKELNKALGRSMSIPY